MHARVLFVFFVCGLKRGVGRHGNATPAVFKPIAIYNIHTTFFMEEVLYPLSLICHAGQSLS